MPVRPLRVFGDQNSAPVAVTLLEVDVHGGPGGPGCVTGVGQAVVAPHVGQSDWSVRRTTLTCRSAEVHRTPIGQPASTISIGRRATQLVERVWDEFGYGSVRLPMGAFGPLLKRRPRGQPYGVASQQLWAEESERPGRFGRRRRSQDLWAQARDQTRVVAFFEVPWAPARRGGASHGPVRFCSMTMRGGRSGGRRTPARVPSMCGSVGRRTRTGTRGIVTGLVSGARQPARGPTSVPNGRSGPAVGSWSCVRWEAGAVPGRSEVSYSAVVVRTGPRPGVLPGPSGGRAGRRTRPGERRCAGGGSGRGRSVWCWG